MKKLISVLFVVVILAISALPFAVTAAENVAGSGAADTESTENTAWSDSAESSDVLTESDTAETTEEEYRISATTAEGEVIDDGINTNAATAWIVGVSAAVAAGIIAVAVYLARKNKNN